MEIVIRKVETADSKEIRVLTEQLGYTISAEQMLQNITAILEHKDCDAFVAVHEERVTGWIGVAYRIQLESAPLCEVNGLVVHEQYRGKGIGRMLIEKAKSWSREKSCGYLRLRTNTKRNEAHTFYLALDFREIKQQKVFEIEI
jgi:GNAT superfamily N-acetyltransferase